MEYLETMAISIILAALKVAVKNPAKAETLKAAMLKIRNQTDLLWPEE
jgi:hypothetical protein